jgi:hypothetical protein
MGQCVAWCWLCLLPGHFSHFLFIFLLLPEAIFSFVHPQLPVWFREQKHLSGYLEKSWLVSKPGLLNCSPPSMSLKTQKMIALG